MQALLWITALMGAVGFAMSGAMKLMEHEMATEVLSRVGQLDKIKLIGAAEVVGAVGLIIGAIASPNGLEWLGLLAALGLVILAGSALLAHQRVGDAPKELFPSAILALISVLYIVALMANN